MLRMPPLRQLALAAAGAALGFVPSAFAERGAVVYATQDAAFVNRGSLDGLAVGEVLTFAPRHGPNLSCPLTAVADHQASCANGHLRAGDALVSPLPAAPGMTSVAPRSRAEPMPPGATQAVLTAPFGKVEFRGAPSVHRGRRTLATAALSHETWTADYSQSTYNLERLDLAVFGAPLGVAGLRASAAASVLVWSSRPGVARYQPGSSVMALVQQAQVDRRGVDEPFAFAAGRIQPAHVPGVWILDGAQASWRSKTGDEVGLYGGAVPDLVTLAPDVSTWSAGAYFAHGASWGRTVQLWDEGRLGISEPVAGAARAEAQGRVNLRLGDGVSFGGDVRAALPFDGSGTPQLDVASANLSTRLGAALTASASYRYLSPNAPEARVLLTTAPGTAGYGSQHGDAAVNWDVVPGFNVGLHGGISDDLGGGTGTRTFTGPTFALPQLLGGRLGLAAGYDQYFLEFHGETAYLQGTFSPVRRLRLLARASFTNDFLAPGTGSLQDIGGYAHAEYDLASFLSVRASALVLYGANLGVDANLTFIGRM